MAYRIRAHAAGQRLGPRDQAVLFERDGRDAGMTHRRTVTVQRRGKVQADWWLWMEARWLPLLWTAMEHDR
jgi:hypothetical protein